jgi:pentatricopeptide repeat protein
MCFEQTENVERAFRLYKEMISKDILPVESTFNALLKVCATRADNYAECFSVLERMRENGLMPDATTYATLLSAAGRMGDIVQAEKLFAEMMRPEHRFEFPNQIHYCSLLRAYARIARAQRIDFREERLKRVEELWTELHERLQEKGQRLLPAHINSYMNVYCEYLNLNEARAIFDRYYATQQDGEEVANKTVANDDSSSNSTSNGDASNVNGKSNNNTNNNVEEKVRPDLISYTTLLRMYVLSRRIDAAEAVWQKMVDEANLGTFQLDARAYSWYLMAVTKVRKMFFFFF